MSDKFEVEVTESESEQYMNGSAQRLIDIHERVQIIEKALHVIPELRRVMDTMSTAQSLMAKSAESMAATFSRFELRAEKQDERYEELVQKASGKDQIPLRSHYWTVAACLIPTLIMGIGAVLGVLYFTKQDIKASLTEIQVNQKKNLEKILDEHHPGN